jgi:hypothetical protein
VLGRAPDEARTKGMPHGSRGRPAKYNGWLLEVPVHCVHAGDGDEGISASVVALGDDLARRLGTLPADECTTTLVIVQEVFGSDDALSMGIHLRVDAMRWLVLANADIDLDQYFYETSAPPGE